MWFFNIFLYFIGRRRGNSKSRISESGAVIWFQRWPGWGGATGYKFLSSSIMVRVKGNTWNPIIRTARSDHITTSRSRLAVRPLSLSTITQPIREQRELVVQWLGAFVPPKLKLQYTTYPPHLCNLNDLEYTLMMGKLNNADTKTL